MRSPELLPKSDLEPADCPPKGYHYDPYSKHWRKNLTEAEVQNLWPYRKETKVEPIKDWLDDALHQVAPKPRKDELYAAPTRLTDGPVGSAVERGKLDGPTREKVQELMEATAFINAVSNSPEAQLDLFGQSTPKPGDNVHLPQHYARYKIEPIRFSIENELDGFQFNIIKYVCRHPFKNKREDLRKALRYLEMYIKYTYDKDPDWWR